MNHRAKIIILSSWSLLGFKRGINSYDYSYKKDSRVKQHLYLEKGIWGLTSTIAYVTPFSFFVVLYKEIYRLEVQLRGLEDEKKTDYYNEVL
jgi:hypothetical protein